MRYGVGDPMTFAPTLVLMPGMDGTGDLFAPVVDVLEPDWKVRVVSYPVDVPVGYAELVPVVEASLPQEPYVLVAESYSGPLALMLAAQRPERLTGVVLCTSFLRSPVGRWANLSLPLARAGMLGVRPPKLAVRHWLLESDTPPALTRAVLAAIAKVDGAVLSQRLHDILVVDVGALAASVGVPVLYLRATRDRLVSEASLTYAQASIPSLSVARVAGPHLLMQCQPKATAEQIAAFCAGLDAAVPTQKPR